MGRASTPPFVYGEGTNRPLYYDVTHACRTEATGEATSPHPVIVGSGRLEDHASAPFSKWAAPPRLPPFMGKARTATFYYDVMHASRA